MLADSKLLDQLERNAFSTAGRPLCLYGDPAYPLRVHLQGPYKHAVLNPLQEDINPYKSWGLRETLYFILQGQPLSTIRRNYMLMYPAEGNFVCACSSERTVNEENRWYALPKCKAEIKQVAIFAIKQYSFFFLRFIT